MKNLQVKLEVDLKSKHELYHSVSDMFIPCVCLYLNNKRKYEKIKTDLGKTGNRRKKIDPEICQEN